MVFFMSILQTTELKKYYGAEPNITRALDGVTLSIEKGEFVAIARALVSKPAIVLADEPTGNLDSMTSSDVLSLLKVTSTKFHQTLVMITHNNEIAQLADRIIRIEDGKIVQ